MPRSHRDLSSVDAFEESARDLAARGVCAIPCGGEDGKKPLVQGFGRRSEPYSVPAIEKFARQFPGANLGVLCGASGLVVIDLDVVEFEHEVIARYGASPLVVRTPSGGVHFYYRAPNRIRSHKLRADDGRIIGDIKAAGGFVVAPPSMRPDGARYRFETGDWAELDRLPAFPTEVGSQLPAHSAETRRIPEGRRNDAMFRYALSQAPYCDTEQDLYDVVKTHADDVCEIGAHSYDDKELQRSVTSAWTYQERGENWVATAGTTKISNDRLDEFMAEQHGPDALFVHCDLVRCHAKRDEPFAIVPKAYASRFHGLSPMRVKRAVELLVTMGLLERVHEGGHGPGDPHLYILVRDSSPHSRTFETPSRAA